MSRVTLLGYEGWQQCCISDCGRESFSKDRGHEWVEEIFLLRIRGVRNYPLRQSVAKVKSTCKPQHYLLIKAFLHLKVKREEERRVQRQPRCHRDRRPRKY